MVPVLELQSVSAHWHRSKEVVGHDPKRSVSLKVAAGEWVLIAGENGVGKSTLLHAIAGSIPNVTGRITVDEVVLDPTDILARFMTGVLFVGQDAFLNGQLSISDAVNLISFRRPALNNELAIKDLCSRLDLMSIMYNGDTLSPRVFDLVSSICVVPRLLLLDEITPALSNGSTSIVATYKRLRELLPFSSVLFVEHNVKEAITIADHVIWLRVGKKPLFFSSNDSVYVEEMLSKLGRTKDKNEIEFKIERFAKLVIRLDLSPLEQVDLALQAREKHLGLYIFNHRRRRYLKQRILRTFKFLRSSHPAEQLSGGQRVILLWILSELSKVETTPAAMFGHLDANNFSLIETIKNLADSIEVTSRRK